MFNFLAISSVEFDDEMLKEVARSTRAQGTGETTRRSSIPVSNREIEDARRLVSQYFVASEEDPPGI